MKTLRWLLITLLVIALGILGAQWIGRESARNLGEVIVRAGGNDYISTLPQALLLLFIVQVALWLSWVLLCAPYRLWKHYHQKQGRIRLVSGLHALANGQWQQAEKFFLAAANDRQLRAVALEAAIRAARKNGDEESADKHLQQLAAVDVGLYALHSARRWLQQDKPLEALAALDQPNLQPLPPRALELRTRALIAAKRREHASEQIEALRQAQVLSTSALAALETELAALEQGDNLNASSSDPNSVMSLPAFI